MVGLAQVAPHPIPPHAGEGAALGVTAGRDCIRRWKKVLPVDVRAPPLPPVGRGRGWGALEMSHK